MEFLDSTPATLKGQAKVAADAKRIATDMVERANADVGRPTVRNGALIEDIWVRIASGESLNVICRDPDMPNRATVMQWMAKDPELEAHIDAAYQYQGRYIVDELRDIADGTDTKGSVEDRKLRAKILMWIAGKYNRKLFGDRMQHDVQTQAININLPPEFAGMLGPVIDGEQL